MALPKLQPVQPGAPIAPGNDQPVNPAGPDIPSAGWENQIDLPWAIAPEVSWLDYRCWVEIELDSGMALHKPLPQSFPEVDTLGSVSIDDADMETSELGINMESNSNTADIIQRMATSTYRFRLVGWGMRAGFTIPIPKLLSVGNSPATPTIQRASNMIVGQFGGVPLWFAQWSLEYIIAAPIIGTGGVPGPANLIAPVPFNPSLKIRPDAELPVAFALPTVPDQLPAGGGAGPNQGPL